MGTAQAQLQNVLDDLIDRGVERGLQVAAYQDGALIVDAWAGLADVAMGRPVDGDTLFPVFSATKGVTATAIHLLAERGLLAYDAPVARYWPEFAAHDKGDITVRHVLSHTAGMPHLPPGLGPAALCDWAALARGIADLAPLWPPGTQTGYHAISWGQILGEIARRVDGRPFGQLVREELGRPLGTADLHIGIPDAVAPRVAVLETDASLAAALSPGADSLYRRAIPLTLEPLGETFSRPDVQRACLPASNGIMTARALARHYAALIGAGVDGVRLLSAERVALATAVQTEAVDLVTGSASTRGLGYVLGRPGSVYGDRQTTFGHAGYGGAIGFADPVHRVAFALAKNRLRASAPGEDTATVVARALRAALGMPEGA